MGIEIFLKLDGITGESQKSGAEGWIEIFSFSNGASNPSSVAFGTGSHPTTALCLQWLDELADERALAGQRVLDFGCGSGILALAAFLWAFKGRRGSANATA